MTDQFSVRTSPVSATVDAGREVPPRLSRDVFHLRHETPFLTIDLDTLADAYERLQRALPAGTAIHFAMKCNAEAAVLRSVRDLGGNFVIASFGELRMLQELGLPGQRSPSEVLFSAPVKAPADIAAAYAAGVRFLAFDSECEAEKLADLAPGASVYVRLKTQSARSEVASEGKFGVSADRAAQLLLYARSLGLRPYGLTFHVGSQMTQATAWQEAINNAAGVMHTLDRAGVRIEMLDLGGGFPVQYAGSGIPSITEIGAGIRRAVDQLPYPVRLVVEPGRFLAAPAGVIVASVIGIADRGEDRWVHVDASAFNAFMEALETANGLRYPVTDSLGQRDTRACHLTGPTCDSQDTILYGVEVSPGLDVGDRVAFWMAGAYTLVYARGRFNGFTAPKTYLFDDAA